MRRSNFVSGAPHISLLVELCAVKKIKRERGRAQKSSALAATLDSDYNIATFSFVFISVTLNSVMPTLLFSQKLTVLIKLGTIVKVETNCLKCRQFNHFWPTDDVLEARGSNAIPIRSAQFKFKWKYYSSKRAVQIKILQFKARCSKITKIRGAQFKCKNNILAPSIGQNLQHCSSCISKVV